MQFLKLENQSIRVLSLFDGISVGMLALKRAGFDVEKYYASEIKTKAMKCSFNNWGDAIEQIGDVRKVDGKKYDVDIIIGGSPCQNFSRARTSHCNVIDGLAGEQSSLFFEYFILPFPMPGSGQYASRGNIPFISAVGGIFKRMPCRRNQTEARNIIHYGVEAIPVLQYEAASSRPEWRPRWLQ